MIGPPVGGPVQRGLHHNHWCRTYTSASWLLLSRDQGIAPPQSGRITAPALTHPSLLACLCNCPAQARPSRWTLCNCSTFPSSPKA